MAVFLIVMIQGCGASGYRSTAAVETNEPQNVETSKEAPIKPNIAAKKPVTPVTVPQNLTKKSSEENKPKLVSPIRPADTSKDVINDKIKPDVAVQTKVKIHPPALPTKVKIITPEPPAEAVLPFNSVTMLEFALEELPITIRNTWVLKRDVNSCSLHSLSYQIDDGVGMSNVSLVLKPDVWVLETNSDIDISYIGTGLDLDSGEHFKLEQVVNETNVRFIEQYQSLNRALKTAKILRVTLGFWPTWPVSNTKTTELKVPYFDIAFKAWEACNQRLSVN